MFSSKATPGARLAAGLLMSAGTLIATAQDQSASTDTNHDEPALEEIRVTARKREERLQDTPISISAFSGAQLEAQGVSQTSRLQDFTPNLVFQNTPSNSGVGSNAAVYIRGIGQKDFAPTTEPGVGIYVDGVYLGRSVGGVFDLIDIERIEVLRGPQGTLFGRNTIGGAISITTGKPDGEFAAKADVTVGTDNRRDVRAMLNMPLADSLFLRISGGSFEQDGYVTRPFDGKDLGNKDYQTGRIGLRWLAADSLEFTLTGEYGRDRTDGPPVVITRVDTPADNPGSFVAANDAIAMGDPNLCFLPANLNVQQCYNQRIVAGRHTNLGTGPNFSDLKTKASALTAEWNLTDALTLKSITAWRALDGAFAQDRDGGPQLDLDSSAAPQFFNPLNQVQDSFRQRQVSQELQLQGKAPQLDWLLGLYYFREYGSNLNPVDFTVVSLQSGGTFHYNSKAAFAQATWQATDKLAITPGARYTKDERAYLPDQYFEELPVGPLPFPCFVPTMHVPCAVGDRIVPYATVRSSANKFTPYLNAAYKWTPDLLSYATFSQGFKSGGYTQRIFPPEASLPSFAPESVKSYELGFKLTALGGGMRLNGAAFYTDYTDMQLLVSDPSRVGPFITNAGKAAIQGFELEWAYAPGQGWQLEAGAGYTDPKYKELANGVNPAELNVDSDFVLISKWSANASVEKLFRLTGGSVVVPRVDYSWRSRSATNASGVPQPTQLPQGFLYQPSYGVLNAAVRWSSASDTLALTVGASNLTDEQYRIFGDYQPSFGFTMEAFNRGRQWYAKGAVKF